MRRHVSRSAGLVAAVAALAGLLTGCAVEASPVDLANVNAVNPPMPGGVQTGSAALPKTQPAANCGDPTASLSPPAAMPSPGQMPSGTTMAKIQARGYLIAGVDQNTYLFGYRNPMDNQLEGFDIDLVHDIAQAIFGDPNKVQFDAITSQQRIPALKSGQVDIVVRTMTISCDRLADVAFSTVYYEAQQRVLVEKNSKVQSINDLGGKKVCAATGSDSLAHIAAVPTHPVPVAVADWSDCLVMLQQDEVDAVSTDDTILAGMVAQDPNTKIVGPGIANEPYGIAIPKQNTDMVRFVNGVLAQVRGNQWQQSYQRWLAGQLGGTGSPPGPTYRD